MKPTLMGLVIGGFLVLHPLAQPALPGGGPRGFPGFGDPARRTEMMVDRLAEDIGLNRDQWKAMKDLFAKAQTSAKPLQDELQGARKAVREAIVAGKAPAELDLLHQQIGTHYAKLAAIQSAAFADALKLLKDDQKNDADVIYEILGIVAGSGGRGGMPMHGGPGGRGPGGLGPGGPPPPGDPGEPHEGFGPPPKPPRDR
jgi:hypothetical protein